MNKCKTYIGPISGFAASCLPMEEIMSQTIHSNQDATFPWLALITLLVPVSHLVAGWLFSFKRQDGSSLNPGISSKLALVGFVSSLIGLLTVIGTGQAGLTYLNSITSQVGIRIDLISVIMTSLVAFLGYVVSQYSIRYLAGEEKQSQFTGWLHFTVASVQILSLSGNLLLFVAAWISTSLCLHQLLTYYSERPGAIAAARKKFVISRLGDLCLGAALFVSWKLFGTWDIGQILDMAANASENGIHPLGISILGWLVVSAAVMKSAQFPFHSWLPDTMETPTPVSALMHAGIINAGGFLIIRFSPLLVEAPTALYGLAIVGAITAIFGSVVMLTQTSIKRSLAYSTIAQMGFMMLQCGLGAFALAFFHLVAHALYKAHAFLASGTLVKSQTPSPDDSKEKPLSPVYIIPNLAIGFGLLFGLAYFFEISLTEAPALILLGSVFLMSWSYLVWNWWKDSRDTQVLFKGVGLGALVILTYFGLHSATSWTFENTLPSLAVDHSLATYALVGMIGLAMFATVWGQAFLSEWTQVSWVRKLYVHASRGFYIGNFGDRLTAFIYKDQYNATPNVAPKSVVHSVSFAASNPVQWNEEKLQPILNDISQKMAPLWSLSDFVAVNPFVGFSQKSFPETCEYFRHVAPGGIQMSAGYYKDKVLAGHITDSDIKQGMRRAIEFAHIIPQGYLDELSVETIVKDLEQVQQKTDTDMLESVSEASDKINYTRWNHAIVDMISDHCAAYFDEAQSSWKMPQRDKSLFQAWKENASIDKYPEILGLKGFRSQVAQMPDNAYDLIASTLHRLNIPEQASGVYLHRLAFSVRGWCGYLRSQSWHSSEEKNQHITDLVAIRLAYELGLSKHLESLGYGEFSPFIPYELLTSSKLIGKETTLLYVLQLSDEYSMEREFRAKLKSDDNLSNEKTTKDIQAIFCIDVRSEVFRRYLESTSRSIQTKGFAGFFGLPIKHQSLGEETTKSQCPVLLEPAHHVCDTHGDATQDHKLRTQSKHKKVIQSGWTSFKQSAISCFSFVETAGIAYVPSLIKNVLNIQSGSAKHSADISPSLAGISLKEQTEMAYGILKNTGLIDSLGKLVLLCGHESQTVNNPYKAGLDCGACGGHSGEVNARVAASILNSADVRARLLSDYEVKVPNGTWFLAGVHNTTTDEVSLKETKSVPTALKPLVQNLRSYLSLASDLTRQERSSRLDIANDGKPLSMELRDRANNWSEMRPEWGLAGNAGMIIAPRARTQKAGFAGKVFLHDYEYQQDEDSQVLELIMTAPMIVASWINLQYYASTANNASFGSGTKITHNVVGGIGVCCGNRGDLLTGLPLQSLHDGEKWMHHPLRLQVCIEAPTEKIESIIKKRQEVAQLVTNQWIHLYAIHSDGTLMRRMPSGQWVNDGAEKPVEKTTPQILQES